MAVEKVSLSLDAEALAEARELVGASGLSAYVSDALRRQLQRVRLVALLAEMDAESGPVDPQVGEAIADSYRRTPQSSADDALAAASAQALIDAEPW